MESVPNTSSFSFWHVCDAIYGDHNAGRNLVQCFADADAAKFDAVYNNSSYAPANSLLRFRNYGGSVGTYDDWRLPTRAEQALMYSNLGPTGHHNFSSDYYWSSEEYDINTAWSRTWVNGGELNIQKTTLDHVRAVRTFTSTDSYNIGDYGQAGGWVFYKSGNDYAEVTEFDLSDHWNWADAATQCDALIIYR